MSKWIKCERCDLMVGFFTATSFVAGLIVGILTMVLARGVDMNHLQDYRRPHNPRTGKGYALCGTYSNTVSHHEIKRQVICPKCLSQYQIREEEDSLKCQCPAPKATS